MAERWLPTWGAAGEVVAVVVRAVNPTPEEAVAFLRRVATFRSTLTEPEQALLDELIRRAARHTHDAEVAGYGLGSWLNEALHRLGCRLLDSDAEPETARLAALAGVWSSLT